MDLLTLFNGLRKRDRVYGYHTCIYHQYKYTCWYISNVVNHEELQRSEQSIRFPWLYMKIHLDSNFLKYTCRRAKIFYLSQLGIESRLDLQANTLPRRCISQLLPQGSRSVLYIPSPVTFSPTKLDFVPKVPGHRESFLMRLGELQLESRLDYLRWAPLS